MSLHNAVLSTTAEVWEALTASALGDLVRLKSLVARTAELATCQYDYTSPLHLAVREGRVAVVEWLLEKRALEPNSHNHPFLEPLATIAEDRRHHRIAELLQAALASPEMTHEWGDTGSIDRGLDDERSEFQELVDKGNCDEAETKLILRPELASDEDAFWGEGILAMPAKDGDRPMMELLMRFGATVPNVSKWGARYYFKRLDVAAFLLKKGMSPNHRNWRQFTLLHDFAFTGDLQKAELLLDHGANLDAIDDEYQSTPLGYAAHWGRLELVELFLDRGANPDKAGAPWATPLAWAQRKGHRDVEEELLRAGAKP